MILYLDASALVKRYLTESGTAEMMATIDHAELVGTVILSRAEVAAALAKAALMRAVTMTQATTQLSLFRKDWNDFERLQVTETLVSRADAIAWQYQLRGYDAIHLAAAVLWQETLSQPITFATYDAHLWSAALQAGLVPFPRDLGQVNNGRSTTTRK